MKIDSVPLQLGVDGEVLMSARDLATYFDVPLAWVRKRIRKARSFGVKLHPGPDGPESMLDVVAVTTVLGGTRTYLASEYRQDAMIRYLKARTTLEDASHLVCMLAKWEPKGLLQ